MVLKFTHYTLLHNISEFEMWTTDCLSYCLSVWSLSNFQDSNFEIENQIWINSHILIKTYQNFPTACCPWCPSPSPSPSRHRWMQIIPGPWINGSHGCLGSLWNHDNNDCSKAVEGLCCLFSLWITLWVSSLFRTPLRASISFWAPNSWVEFRDHYAPKF